MNLHSESLKDYLNFHVSKEDEALAELDRETNLTHINPIMLSGHNQGVLLKILSAMIQPKNILEIGTYTGYSGICLASGLVDGGKLTTIDRNEELETIVRKYFKKAGLSDRLDFHVGNAIDIILELDITFDMVFIDADKINYSNYFDLIIDKVRTGGIIMADNVLWSGKVLEENKDKETEALDIFNKKVTEDPRVENLIMPIRDGIMLMRKL